MSDRSFDGKTVVITGASSGLGRAAALEFARAGADLGLIARDEGALIEVASDVERLGGRAVVAPLDVTDALALDAAADRIARELGSIDVWVNNAAVAVYGEVLTVPLDEMKRVMDVNFFGQVNGARSAIPYLEESTDGPTLLGVLSVLSEAATPLQSTYTASKHALDGFYETLSEELAHRGSRVRIGTLFAPSMATPLFDHAKTYTGYRPKPLAPVYSPERYARVLVEMAERPRQRVLRGAFARFATFAFRQMPRLANWFQARTGYAAQRSDTPKRASDGDNLRAPMETRFGVRGSTASTPFISTLERVAGGLALAGVLIGSLRLGRRLEAGASRGRHGGT